MTLIGDASLRSWSILTHQRSHRHRPQRNAWKLSGETCELILYSLRSRSSLNEQMRSDDDQLEQW